MADPAGPKDPILDIRVRWRAGQVLLGLAGALTLVALLRPLAPWSPSWLKAADALAIGLGVSAAAFLGEPARPEARGHASRSTASWCFRWTRSGS